MEECPKFFAPKYGGFGSKVKREQSALREFAKALSLQGEERVAAMSVSDALASGQIREVNGATVDGVLLVDDRLVAVELLGYAPVSDRGDVIERDAALRNKIGEALCGELCAKEVWITLYYLDVERASAVGGRVKAVPADRLHGKFVEELRTVIDELPAKLPDRDFTNVRFGPDDWCGRRDGFGDTHYVSAKRFTCLSEHLWLISFQHLGPRTYAWIHSNLSGGNIGLSTEWLTKCLKEKAAKSDLSLRRANKLPLWLLVHADGHAINRTIPEHFRPRFRSECAEILGSVEHRFQRAYVADQTGFVDAAWVARVL